MHKDVMRAIRNMEPAWEQERGRKFALTQIREEIPNGGYRLRPVFMLTKTDGVPVRSHEVQRRGARTAGAKDI